VSDCGEQCLNRREAVLICQNLQLVSFVVSPPVTAVWRSYACSSSFSFSCFLLSSLFLLFLILCLPQSDPAAWAGYPLPRACALMRGNISCLLPLASVLKWCKNIKYPIDLERLRLTPHRGRLLASQRPVKSSFGHKIGHIIRPQARSSGFKIRYVIRYEGRN